ncbi:MAG TPA: biotin/lipoyl-binding protein, partial [Burkholderiales bacterium]|nr:biotin/lipoyl-binding protein [Burkholderiales bacterium]
MTAFDEVSVNRAAEFIEEARQRAEEQREPEAPRTKRPLIIGTVLLLVVFASVAGWRAWLHAARWVKTDNAMVAGHVHYVSSRIPGTVMEVLAEDNASVEAGSVLARLDRSDLLVKRDQAQAALNQAAAQVTYAQSEKARAEARVLEEQAQLRKAELDQARAQRLFRDSTGAISKQEFDNVVAAFEARQASL